MKKMHIFSFLMVLFSVLVLSGCGKELIINAPQDTPEYSMRVLDTKNNQDVTYHEGTGFKVKSGRTVKIKVSFKKGWEASQAKLFAGDKQLTLTKENAFSDDDIWVAQLKVESNIKLEVRNLDRKTYTVKMPVFPEKVNYMFYNGTNPITSETLSVKYGDDLTIRVYPKEAKYALPKCLYYDLGDTFDYNNAVHYCAYPATDLYGRLIYQGTALDYNFFDVTTNFVIDVTYASMPEGHFVKRVFLDLESNSEYSLGVMIDNGLDEHGNRSFKNFDNVRNQKLYIYLDEFSTSDYVKNLTAKRIVVKDDKGEIFEVPIETAGEDKGYFVIPAAKVTSNLAIRLQQNPFDDNNLDAGKYYGTFKSHLSDQIPYNPVFRKDDINLPKSYTAGEKIYLTVGDILLIPRTYGDTFTMETTNIVLNEEMYKSSSYLEDYDLIKYTVESIESNNFTIELSTASEVTIPFADLNDEFIIEYRIGHNTNHPFIKINNASTATITVRNLEPLIIKLTSKNGQPAWANFDLTTPIHVYNQDNIFEQNYLDCKVEERVGGGYQLYPQDGISYYTVAWFMGDTILIER